MAEHLYGVFGNAETTEEMIDAGLSELRDAADAAGEAFWFIFGVTPDSPDIMGSVFQWAIENDVTYDIVVHPTVADKLPEDYTGSAGKVTKIKDVEKKVVDRLLAEDGRGVLLLAGNDGDGVNSDELLKTAQRAFDAKLLVLALDDANNSLDFSEATNDVLTEAAVEEEEDVDFEALGAAGDEGDDEAIAKLTELGAAVNIDAEEHAELSWAEFAELVAETTATVAAEEEEAKPSKPAAKTAKSSPKAASSTKANTWTQEALEAKGFKDLKEIAKAAAIDGYGKLGNAALIKALLGKPTGEEAEPEAEAEVASEPAKTARTRTPKTTTSTNGDAVNGELVAIAKGLILIAEEFIAAHA